MASSEVPLPLVVQPPARVTVAMQTLARLSEEAVLDPKDVALYEAATNVLHMYLTGEHDFLLPMFPSATKES